MWAIIIIGGLIALVLFFLWVPLDMVLGTDIDRRPRLRLKFSWLFGLVSREMSGGKEKPAAVRKKRRRVGIAMLLRLVRTPGLLKRLKRFITEVLACLRLRNIKADLRVGLGDPAATGLMFTVIGPVTALFGSSRLHQVCIQPSFSDNVVFEGYSQGTVRLRPIRLLPPLLKFAFSLPALRAARTLVVGQWGRRK